MSVYGPPGAFTASVQWYRSGSLSTSAAQSGAVPAPGDRLATPAFAILWPEHDPLFPREWSDRIGEFFSQARLRFVDGAGHYAPLEYPAVIAEEVSGFLAARLRLAEAAPGDAGSPERGPGLRAPIPHADDETDSSCHENLLKKSRRINTGHPFACAQPSGCGHTAIVYQGFAIPTAT